MVSAEEAVYYYQLLTSNHIPLWITGGWGVDALLEVQTRTHKDLDVLIRLEDVPPMFEIQLGEGFTLKEVWSENSWVTRESNHQIPTAFVLHDTAGHEIDAHALSIDMNGDGIPAWNHDEGFIFSKNDLSTIGLIDGHRVMCISPRSQLLCHSGYELPEYQKRDLEGLLEKFGKDQVDTWPFIRSI